MNLISKAASLLFFQNIPGLFSHSRSPTDDKTCGLSDRPADTAASHNDSDNHARICNRRRVPASVMVSRTAAMASLMAQTAELLFGALAT